MLAEQLLADELAAGYGVDSRITGLLQLVDVYIVPIVNPDGYEYTYAPGGDRFWRKNRRDNGTGCDGVSYGVKMSLREKKARRGDGANFLDPDEAYLTEDR